MNKDMQELRKLAKIIAEKGAHPSQGEKKKLWRDHNSKRFTKPLIHMGQWMPFYHRDVVTENMLKCEDSQMRHIELLLREKLFLFDINDDTPIDPWFKSRAVYKTPVSMRWGVNVDLGEKLHEAGAAAFNPVLNSEEDLNLLKIPIHEIDEETTEKNESRLNEIFDGIIPVDVMKRPVLSRWEGDLSTDLAKMRGLEQIMWDAYDRPEWFHKVLAFMRDAVLKNHEDAEKAGDWSLTCSENQAALYTDELADPQPNKTGVKRKELWGFFAAQEFTTFGPDLFNEFMLEYQIPIMEKFGLVSYGCCEDLTQKIDLMHKIPNLRRLSVTPFANVKSSAEQIGSDYIISWRPNPSTMISTGLDEDFVRKHMQENFEYFKANNCKFDICLKDVETINGQPGNVKRWMQIVHEEIEKAF